MKEFSKTLAKCCLALFILLNIIVILHAYKLTHFYERDELTDKNSTARNGWDITKDILLGPRFIKQQNSVRDSGYMVTYLQTSDGLKLEAWEFKQPMARGTVALFHGHGSKKSGLLAEAKGFTMLGYNTLLLDFRAHGSSDGNTCTIGFYEAEDVKLAYDHLAARGEKNIILFGASMGAATITKAIDQYALKPAKIILDMPFASLSDAVTGRLKIMHLPPQPLGTMLTFWGGVTQGFWAFNHNPYEYAQAIQCPVLLQRGKNDVRVTQAETDKIFDNIRSPKKMVIYNNSGHESLCKKEPEKWLNEVTSFLQ